MSKDIQIKQHVLDMLKQFLMGEEGSKFKPKAISVEMMGKPKVIDEEGGHELESLLGGDEEHEMPMEEEMEPEGMDELEGEVKKPKMSLKDYLASR